MPPTQKKAPARTHATVGQLLGKPARTKTVEVNVADESGNPVELSITLRAIGAKAYDDLLGNHPPTAAQRKEQAVYNLDTFAPELLSMCCTDPVLTVEEANEVWTSDQWSRGELMQLFLACVEVNSSGLDVPFSASA